jgi:hypothetical protein
MFAELAPKKGLFPPEVLLGENPPTVLDLTDDEVSADVWLARVKKAVVVSAEEVEIPV